MVLLQLVGCNLKMFDKKKLSNETNFKKLVFFDKQLKNCKRLSNAI